SRFDGEWHLRPLGDAGCRIDFALDYDFERALLRTVAGAVFDRITNTLVDAFVARADALGDRIPRVGGVTAVDGAATRPVAAAPAAPPAAPPVVSPPDPGDLR
ncbi:MAG: hypothetical protein KJ018_05425, partial [Burkholderiales bacterium]|nr:hypothetical protein [Burkholderiales bacterium]